MTESLTLKWGTIKGWSGLTEMSVEIIKRYYVDGMPMSCIDDRPDDARKKILCELIDQIDGEIWNDWEGCKMSKDNAKKYVIEYGKFPFN